MEKKQELLKLIKPLSKVWLKPLEKYRINIAYETSTEITPRTIEVSDAFGLGVDKTRKFQIYDEFTVDIGPKDIVYITGDSGSGKSVLLKWLEQALQSQTINIKDVHVNREKALVNTIGETTQDALELLSRVGLNDAFIFLRRYRELSDGQKYRYCVAKMLEAKAQYWVFDEFCSLLDRDTAKIVAYNIQKLARKQGRAVLAATTHGDLFEDLKPSVHVQKRFGSEVKLAYFPNSLNRECSLSQEIRIEEGSREDWKALAHFHYRSHRCPFARAYFKAVRGFKSHEELCGVVVYCYPPQIAFGRRKVLPKMSMKKLNATLSQIRRVVVHPKYRTIGLGQRLIRESLPLSPTPCVELIAVMAKYNPFAEKAGMKKVAMQKPNEDALGIAETLRALGFNLNFLGGNAYVLRKLKSLKSEELSQLREVLAKHRHPRFMKEFFHSVPYGRHGLYPAKIYEADLSKLAKLIKIVGLLLQTKVYLFWEK